MFFLSYLEVITTQCLESTATSLTFIKLLPWVVYENIVFDFSGPSLKIGNPLIVEEDEWDAKGQDDLHRLWLQSMQKVLTFNDG